MKTAISLPDHVFREAERYAHRTKRTRSQLYSEALAEYLARHSSEAVTAAMNSVVDRVGPAVDRFASAAARRTLERTER
jgi:metal-responsive CopG/Arc/MetJ family transcriptional regulator